MWPNNNCSCLQFNSLLRQFYKLTSSSVQIWSTYLLWANNYHHHHHGENPDLHLVWNCLQLQTGEAGFLFMHLFFCRWCLPVIKVMRWESCNSLSDFYMVQDHMYRWVTKEQSVAVLCHRGILLAWFWSACLLRGKSYWKSMRSYLTDHVYDKTFLSLWDLSL